MCQYEKHKYFIMNHHNYSTANKVYVWCMYVYVDFYCDGVFCVYLYSLRPFITGSFFLIYVLSYGNAWLAHVDVKMCFIFMCITLQQQAYKKDMWENIFVGKRGELFNITQMKNINSNTSSSISLVRSYNHNLSPVYSNTQSQGPIRCDASI